MGSIPRSGAVLGRDWIQSVIDELAALGFYCTFDYESDLFLIQFFPWDQPERALFDKEFQSKKPKKVCKKPWKAIIADWTNND